MDSFLESLVEYVLAALRLWPGVLAAALLGWLGIRLGHGGHVGFAIGAAIGALVGTQAGASLRLASIRKATGIHLIDLFLNALVAFIIVGIAYVALLLVFAGMLVVALVAVAVVLLLVVVAAFFLG